MSIAFVQSASGHGTGAQAKAFNSNNTGGNMIIVVGCFAGTTGTNTVSDTAGNTYSSLASFLNGNSTLETQLFYAFSIAGGSNTVTFTPGTGGVDTGIAIHEFSGLNTFDVESHNSGSGTSATSNSATTNFADELLFGFTSVILNGVSASILPGAGYTQAEVLAQNGASLVSFLTEYQIVATTSSYAATSTPSAGKGGASNWAAQIATFYQAAATSVPNALMMMGVGS